MEELAQAMDSTTIAHVRQVSLDTTVNRLISAAALPVRTMVLVRTVKIHSYATVLIHTLAPCVSLYLTPACSSPVCMVALVNWAATTYQLVLVFRDILDCCVSNLLLLTCVHLSRVEQALLVYLVSVTRTHAHALQVILV